PRAVEPFTLFLILITSVMGAVIGMQLIVTLGISANTAIIGALLAMVISRIPIAIMKKYRSVHRQNIIQTAISSATFGAANSLLIPIGIPFL
ncbi:OPT family oligopeptide transporter, partial [Rhizobium ruizarguesonis]